MKGNIKWYKGELSYGFITSEEGVDHFFHKSEYKGNYSHLKPGNLVYFNSQKNEKGMTATSVRKHEHEDPRVECPSCSRKIRPNIRYSDGMMIGSNCPYCLSTVESVSTSDLLWSQLFAPLIIRGIAIVIFICVALVW